jgi:hypothetical protein
MDDKNIFRNIKITPLRALSGNNIPLLAKIPTSYPYNLKNYIYKFKLYFFLI